MRYGFVQQGMVTGRPAQAGVARRWLLPATVIAIAALLPAPALHAVSVQFDVRLQIRSGVLMTIEPMSNPDALRRLIAEFGTVLPEGVSQRTAYVAKLSFAQNAGNPPSVEMLVSDVSFKSKDNRSVQGKTFALTAQGESGPVALVGAYVPAGSLPDEGVYEASATVQVLFQ